MYVEPNTTIHLLERVPLNKSYEHTVHYPNKTEQFNAFMRYKVYTLNNYSYQRAGIGTIRINLPYSSVYRCNYMLFANESYEDRWFYAFVDGASYVSNDVTEIYYTIDVLQTFSSEYWFKPCFVERMHTFTDVVYENTQPEGLELGPDYRINNWHEIDLIDKDDSKKKFLILATTTATGGKVTCGVRSNTVMGLAYVECTGIDDVKSTVQLYIDNGYAANIVAIYTLASEATSKIEFTRKKTLDGYTPKNMKLYSYPFSFIEMNNRIGDSLELKYENFNKSNTEDKISSLDNVFKFTSFNNLSPTIPDARLFAWSYLNGGMIPAFGYSVGYSLFPQGAIADDSFKAWLAQNQNSYVASLNAIGQQYDTNVAIAQNAYDMASRSASASLESNSNSINTSLANAQMANATAVNVNRRSANAGSVANLANMGTGLIASAVAQNPLSALSAGVSALTTQNSIKVNEQNTADTLATQLLTADNSAMTALANSNLAYSTAMKNASTSQASATLSAITSANIATAQLVAKKQDAEHQPSNMKGQIMAYSFNTAMGEIGFAVLEKCVRKEYAKMIDDYFEKYGYAVRQLINPSIMTRPHWTYLKTCGCIIDGVINAQDAQTIKGIYDNGITTWKKLEEVGNYNLDNHEGIITER